MELIRIDDTKIDFSWVQCCKLGKCMKDNRKLLFDAMRHAIKNDTIHFKRTNTLICNICRDNTLKYTDYEVDHNIIPFRTLACNFLKDEIDIPTKFDDSPIYNISMFKNEDKEFEKKWIDYHILNCDLQILCKNCNRKKH
jgi:hypothetical protein